MLLHALMPVLPPSLLSHAPSRFILNGSAEQAEAKAFAEVEMRKKLEDRPWVADVIVPTDFAVGCRRPTPGNGYLEALCHDKVTVVPAGIASIDGTGIVDAKGVHHEVDVIICATGFDVSWRPRYPLIGKGGLDLRDAWANGPDNYLSVTVPNFPNFYSSFCLLPAAFPLRQVPR